MNEQRIVEEQGIGFADFLWALLEQWRGIIAAGIIFAILLAGAKHAVNVRAAGSAANKADTAEESVGEFTMHDAAYDVVRKYKNWQDSKDYYENSPLMVIDPSNEERYILRYFVSSENPGKTDFYSIEGCYRLMVNDEDFAGSMSGIFADKIQDKFVRELFTVNPLNETASGELAGKGFTVVVTLVPQDEKYDFEQIRNTVTKYITDKRDKLKKTFGDFDISLISEDYAVINYEGRREAQVTAYNKLVSYENQFQTAYDKLSRTDREVVDKAVLKGDINRWLIENRTQEESGSAQAGGSTEKKKVSYRFPKKFAALGFIIGMFLYAAFVFFRAIFSRKIRDGEEIGQVTGLRSFGSVCKYPYTGWKRFLHSKKIYELRHRKDGKPEPAAARIAKKVSARASHLNVSNLCMIVLGRGNDWTKSVVLRQEKVLQKDGIPCSVIFAEEGVSSIDESAYGGMGTALIVVLSEAASPAMAANLLTRLQEYKVPVLGTEFLEGA